MMNGLIYWLGRALVGALWCMPLSWVALLGRGGGNLAWWLDGRHRRVALTNLTACFGETLDPAAIRALAGESFRRLGESYACGLATAGMALPELLRHCEFVGTEKFAGWGPDSPRRGCVVAIGHFGNFELYARFGQFRPGFSCGTTYRGTGTPGLDRLVSVLRERSGCRFFERRTEGVALKAAMAGEGLLLGLLCDQHAGDRGLRLPFFGRECSTSSAPAVFALRYNCPLLTAVCFRTGPARWRIEVGDEIPAHADGRPRTTAEIMTDVNRVFEAAVRRDPANWFWVHRRWKSARAPRDGLSARESSVPASAPDAP